MRRIITALIVIVASVAAYAQMSRFGGAPAGAAAWNARIEMTGAKTGKLVLTMTPSKGWHIYGFEVGEGGPKAMSADFTKSVGVKFKGDLKPSVTPVKTHDDVFDVDVTYWEGKVVFTRSFEVTDPRTARITGVVNYQGCNDETCTSPQKYNIALTVPAGTSNNSGK